MTALFLVSVVMLAAQPLVWRVGRTVADMPPSRDHMVRVALMWGQYVALSALWAGTVTYLWLGGPVEWQAAVLTAAVLTAAIERFWHSRFDANSVDGVS